MSNISKALLWAGIIIAAALIMSGIGISNAASSSVVLGLSGAAWATIRSDSGCGRRCPS